MHWFAIALLALVVGFILGPIQSLIGKVVPASASQYKVVSVLINGGIVLLTVFAAVFLLSVIGVRESKI